LYVCKNPKTGHKETTNKEKKGVYKKNAEMYYVSWQNNCKDFPKLITIVFNQEP
jgi:hypothetical protein